MVRRSAASAAVAACLALRFLISFFSISAMMVSMVGVSPHHAQAADAPGKPKRIVSMNLCADELVLRLANRENIASVTWLSRDPTSSNVADLAAHVPINRGLAEEIVPLNPDLVIAGVHTARAAVALLKRSGFSVLDLEVPRSLDEVRAQIRKVAIAVAELERGAQMIADMDARFAAISAGGRRAGLRALVLDPNGFTAGPGSLVDQIITTAGLTNAAAELGGGSYARIPLEIAATSGADIFIVNGRRDGPPSLATELLRHPILAKLPHRSEPIILPSRLWTCGGPAVLDAIDLLSDRAAHLRETGAAE